MKQTVRIIAGKYRGRKLQFPVIEGLRPTSDRIRETLFNWLINDIRNARVLDAFAGSGALGLEAASRGAKKVVLVESAKPAADALRKQAKSWGTENVVIINQDVLKYLQHTEDTFDIVFLDPPFDSTWLKPTVDVIMKRQLICSQGLLYVETNTRQSFENDRLQLIKEKIAGQVCYRLMKNYIY